LSFVNKLYLDITVLETGSFFKIKNQVDNKYKDYLEMICLCCMLRDIECTYNVIRISLSY